LWDGEECVAEFVEGDVEVLATGADGPHDASDAVCGGVGVGEQDVDSDHVGLDGEVGIFPRVE
jgi:hypothetical protein